MNEEGSLSQELNQSVLNLEEEEEKERTVCARLILTKEQVINILFLAFNYFLPSPMSRR